MIRDDATLEELEPSNPTSLLSVGFTLESVRVFQRDEQGNPKPDPEGRPVFADVEYVHIRIPGDKTLQIDEPATDLHRKKYAAEYEAFKAGLEAPSTGTPLRTVPYLTKSQVEMLAYNHVKSEEQLAGLSDDIVSKIGPIQAIRQKARDRIAAGKDSAHVQQIRSELEKRDGEIETLKHMLAEQGAALEKLAKQPQRKAG